MFAPDLSKGQEATNTRVIARAHANQTHQHPLSTPCRVPSNRLEGPLNAPVISPPGKAFPIFFLCLAKTSKQGSDTPARLTDEMVAVQNLCFQVRAQ